MKRNHNKFYYEIIEIKKFNKKKYDSILIMMNKLIKYFYIIVYKKNYIVKQFEFIILNKLIKYYNILSKLTNDKNKFSTFNY